MRRIVLRCPEITLKGRNRADFEQALVANVGCRLRALEADWPVHHAHGRLYVDVPDDGRDRLPAVLQALAEVAGVDSLAASVWLRPRQTGQHLDDVDTGLIERTMVELAAEHVGEGDSFAVRVNRVDKRLPLTSVEMERWLGAAIRRDTAWDRVDLSRPDCLFAVDVYPDGIYFRAGKLAAIGGLPVGTGGRVLALLSGGIDSPVAAFMMAKRGCRVDFFHLAATHAQQRDEGSPVLELARHLSRFTLRSRLFTAPATHLDLQLAQSASGYEALLFRRFLTRAAEVLARRLGAHALVVGDSLGQVASQTLENLVSVYRANEMPVLQPLIGFNKQETIAVARDIGTYEISIARYKDCCALLTRSPRTRSSAERLAELERELLPDYGGLIQSTLDDLVWRRFHCGRRVGGWRAPARGGVPAELAATAPSPRPSD